MPGQSRNFFSLASARVPEHLEFEGGFWLNFAADALTEYDADGERIASPASFIAVGDVVASIGIMDRVEVGLDIPIWLSQGSDSSDDLVTELDGGAGLGDIRVIPKVLIFSTAASNDDGGVALAFLLPLSLPTGDQENFRGSGFSATPTVAFDAATSTGVRAGVNLGFTARPEAQVIGTEFNNALVYGVGFQAPIEGIFDVVVEFAGEAGVAAAESSSTQNPLEAIFGAEWGIGESVVMNVGLGRGLTDGVGSPAWRFLLGAAYVRIPNPDRDDDGILNRDDACEERAEDFDGFEDEDGCPEPDNDEDGVSDLADACPLEAEDDDGFEDSDGCPDTDNDADTIADDVDACPDEAEDVDGFEDTDGCPEADNDGDGILDADDACADAAEDMDGFEDTDGCPELDNDEDGVLDDADQCPTEAESINAVADDDGCPDQDQSSVWVDYGASRIYAEPAIAFGISDGLEPASTAVLDDLAAVLTTYADLNIRVVVYSGDRANEQANLDISQRRAARIVTHLTNAGVAAERIQTTPYSIPAGSPDMSTRAEIRIAR